MLIVIDTGPLTHFAQAELLETLRSLLDPYDACVYPREVFEELRKSLGGPGRRNLGEAACMAIAAAHDEVVYLDDSEGGLLAEQHGLQVTTTVDLLLDAVEEERLSRQQAREIVETLLGTGYRLPSWALAAFN